MRIKKGYKNIQSTYKLIEVGIKKNPADYDNYRYIFFIFNPNITNRFSKLVTMTKNMTYLVNI